MQRQPLEIAETLRTLWEQSEALERSARSLGEAAARLTHASRHVAERHVLQEPPDLLGLLCGAGACAEIGQQVAECSAAISDALGELPLRLEAEAPSEVATRATEALRRRVLARG